MIYGAISFSVCHVQYCCHFFYFVVYFTSFYCKSASQTPEYLLTYPLYGILYCCISFFIICIAVFVLFCILYWCISFYCILYGCISLLCFVFIVLKYPKFIALFYRNAKLKMQNVNVNAKQQQLPRLKEKWVIAIVRSVLRSLHTQNYFYFLKQQLILLFY